MDPDDDVPLILTCDEANSGLLNEETERGDESKHVFTGFKLHLIIDIFDHRNRDPALLSGHAECLVFCGGARPYSFVINKNHLHSHLR